MSGRTLRIRAVVAGAVVVVHEHDLDGIFDVRLDTPGGELVLSMRRPFVPGRGAADERELHVSRPDGLLQVQPIGAQEVALIGREHDHEPRPVS